MPSRAIDAERRSGDIENSQLAYELDLKDARAKIKLSPSDPLGYIRAGKVLLLMKKPQNAQALLERGLLNVSANHPKRQIDVLLTAFLTLEDILKRLVEHVTPKLPPVDPFTRLPHEVATLVLQYLDFRSVVTSLRVCKGWNTLISSLLPLWETIDFSYSKRPVQISQARACIRRSPKCRKVVLKRVIDPNQSLLYDVLSQCRSIESVETDHEIRHRPIIVCEKLKTLIVSGSHPSRIDYLERLISGMPILERLDLRSVTPILQFQWRASLTKLKVLNLSAEDKREGRSDFQAVKGLLDSAPGLEELYLTRWSLAGMDDQTLDLSALPALRIIGLTDVRIGQPILPISVQQITVSKCADFGRLWEDNTVQPSLPNLRSLSLRGSNASVLYWGADLLRTSAAAIECLDLDMVCQDYQFIAEEIIAMGHAGRLTNLKELHLPLARALGDESVKELVAVGTEKLELVDFSYSSITGAGIKQLVLTQKNLRKLILRDCTDLSYDAVEWARARGILVDSSTFESRKDKFASRIRSY